MIALGIDTSNYTTSVAWFNGQTGEHCGRLLSVKSGELGAQAVRCFVSACGSPAGTDAAAEVYLRRRRQIGASERPRPVGGSYMPCFLAGCGTGKSMRGGFGRSIPRLFPSGGTFGGSALERRSYGTDAGAVSCLASVRRHHGAAAGRPVGTAPAKGLAAPTDLLLPVSSLTAPAYCWDWIFLPERRWTKVWRADQGKQSLIRVKVHDMPLFSVRHAE